MKAIRMLSLPTVAFFAFASVANAQIVVGAGDGVGDPNTNPVVTIPLTFDCQGGESPQAAQWDVIYNAEVFSNVDQANCLADVNPPGGETNFSTCTVVGLGDGVGTGNDAVRVVLLFNPAANVCAATGVAGSVGTIDFTIDSNALPQNVPLIIDVEAIDGNPAFSTSNGSVTVTAPAGAGFYTSTPNPGGTLALGSAVVGQTTTPDVNLNVQNLSPDTNFDVTAVTQTAGPGGVLNTPVGATVPFGSNIDFPFSCTPSQRGTGNGGSFTVTHDSANGAASPVAYNFSCAGLAPNVQLPANITINGTVGGADPTGNLNVTNPQDGFTSIANNVTATAGTGDAEVTVTTVGSANIAAGGNFDFVVSCDSGAEGNFVRAIDFAWTNPDPAGPNSGSVQVTCNISDTAPEYSSDPAPGDMLSMSADFGQTSAAQGIDVSNSNTNTEADDLTISSATADNAIFDVSFFAGPFAPGAAAVTDAIEVACTPEGVGTVTGTLSVQTNDPSEPTGGFAYDLECVGTGDVLTTVPASGTLGLPQVPPQNETSGQFDLNNNSLDDTLNISCTIDDPDGVFTFDPDPVELTIAAGDSGQIDVTAVPPAVGNFNATLECTEAEGLVEPFTLTAIASGRPLIIPTLSQWGLLVLMLSLLMVGGFAARRTMA